MKKLIIYFIRHAKSIYDSKIHDEQRTLSLEGEKQATALIPKLLTLNIKKIYSSPAKRAIDTIAPFAKKANLEIEIVPEFREREVQPCDSLETYIENVRKTWEDFNFKPKGWETSCSCQNRSFKKLKELGRENKNSNIVISSHGTVTSLCLNKINPSWSFDEWKALPMPAVIEVSYENGSFSVQKVFTI
jgi:2,3-bisphosphoglycerate-dependent phosphoglycerate mutase